jgi:hypothetical protein
MRGDKILSSPLIKPSAVDINHYETADSRESVPYGLNLNRTSPIWFSSEAGKGVISTIDYQKY